MKRNTDLDCDLPYGAASSDHARPPPPTITTSGSNVNGAYDTRAAPEPIAIVGMACRLPGGIASDSDLWEFLSKARSAQSDVPSDRFNVDAFYKSTPDLPDSVPTHGGYFINEDLRLFENAFFGINNLEATTMDPQQRKLLEVCFECLESAGIALDHIAGTNVGCYVGNFTTDFHGINGMDPGYLHRLVALGQGATILSNRISYVLDLKGPSLTLDTACSSTLYCLHLAVQALRNHECDAAFVAGANLIQSPEMQMLTGRLGVLSKTSTCHTFASTADGYGRADGVGALYVKRLSDAIRDGDPIRSIIRGTAINSNGKGNGITLPSVVGQCEVIARAYADAGISRSCTDYVECHGTGTQVGDLIEVAAVSNFFRRPDSTKGSEPPIYVGSVKSNLGHSEAASAITSIIKATLALEKQWIPPTIGVTELNPNIPWHENAVQVVTNGMAWPSSPDSGACRRVSVNSFGYGGANAHCVLENYASASIPLQLGAEDESENFIMLLPFSAATEFSLLRRVEDLASTAMESIQLQDLAYTLIKRRSYLPYRGYIIAQRSDWPRSLNIGDLNPTVTKSTVSDDIPLAYIFTGQGAQWAAMGNGLYERFPVFRRRIQNLDEVLASLPLPPEQSLKNLLIDSVHAGTIHLPQFSQPACTAVQIALVDLLRHWDVMPRYVIGHSSELSGEIAAAYAAGYITAASAITIAYGRGITVSQSNIPGAMLATGMSESDANVVIRESQLDDQVCVACVNSPENVTISGDAEAIEQLSDRLVSLNRFARKVKTGGKAYHSQHMKLCGQEYEDFLKTSIPSLETTLTGQSSSTVMISSVHACVVHQSDVANTSYWRQNLESPVLFKQAIEVLMATEYCQMLEVGPHPALELVVKQTITQSHPAAKQFRYMTTIVRNKDGARNLMSLAGSLWSQGHPIRLDRVNDGDSTELRNAGAQARRPRVLTNLPRYPWCYGAPLWNESRLSTEHRFRSFGHDELLGSMIPGMSGATFTWRNRLDIKTVPWLEDHRLGNDAIYPGAAYIEMALKAVQQLQPVNPQQSYIEIQDLRIIRALQLSKSREVELFTELHSRAISSIRHSSTTWEFVISTFEEGQSIRRASGNIAIVPNASAAQDTARPSNFVEEAQGVRNWYRRFNQVGLGFGPAFQTLRTVHSPRMRNCFATRAELQAETVQPTSDRGRYGYNMHPTVIDSQFQAALIAITGGRMEELQAHVPTSISRIQFLPGHDHANMSSYHIHAQAWPIAAGLMASDIQLVNGTGHPILAITNLNATLFSSSLAAGSERSPMLHLEWIPQLHHLPPGHCDGLTTILSETSALLGNSDAGDAIDVAQLLRFAAMLRYNSSILLAAPLVSNDTTYALLGGGSSHPLFGSLTCLDFANESVLEGRYVDEGFRAVDWPIYRPLAGESFDTIVTDDASAHHLTKLVRDNLKQGGLVIHWGDLPSSIFSDSNVLSTSMGSNQNLHLLRRSLIPRSLADADGPIICDDALLLVTGDGDNTFDDNLYDVLVKSRQVAPTRCTLKELDRREISSDTTAIVTAELHTRFLAKASVVQFDAVKMITSQVSRIIWVVGGSLYASQSPEAAAVLGLARAVMVEQPATRFQVVGLETPIHDIGAATKSISDVLQQATTTGSDSEFIQRHGVLHVSRCIPDPELNRGFNDRQSGATQMIKCGDAGRIQLDIGQQGQFDTLHFRQQTEEISLARDHVNVEVKAIGMNAKDVYSLSGRVPTHERTFALDYSGIVTKTGADVKDLRVGDRVVMCRPGPFSTAVSVPEWACVRMEDDETFTQMSTVALAYMTALHGLVDRARLQRSESVLIHSATGGVGMAAIQIAREIGATIFVTVGTDEKRDRLVREFGIRSDHIFNSRDVSFLDGIMKVTDGAGVDVVLNSLTGERLHASIKACAMFGRFVEIGKRDIMDSGNLDMSDFIRGLTFTAFDLSEYYYAKSQPARAVWGRLLRQAVDAYRRCPVPGPHVFDIGRLEDAMRSFANGTRMGKICVSFENGESLVKVKPARHAYRFSLDKEYLLVGCLGGLGRSLSRYMLENGARHFVFIGRSGTDKPAAKSLVDDLILHGASVRVVRGDVQDYETVLAAVNGMKLPLGGVIQAAMGLSESLFQDMSHAAWRSTLGPKVQGSWNIHRAIEGRDSGLEFFLLTSSVSGSIGAATESNYCAANSFLDYFAKYRRSKGKTATAIGFGAISEIGYLHEHPDIERMLDRQGMTAVTEAEFLDICDIALCSQATTGDTRSKQLEFAHILTGLEALSKRSPSIGQDALVDPRLSTLLHAGRDSITAESGGQSSSSDSLPPSVSGAIAAKNQTATVQAVLDCLAGKMSQLVLMPVDQIGSDMTLSSVGMDSMLAAEYRSFIFRTLKVDVPFITLMDPKTSMGKVATLVAEQLLLG